MSDGSDTIPSSSRPTSPVNDLPERQTARPYRFTWDPSSRRAGPGSVISEGTDARGDYFGFAPQSFAFDGSASLALGALPPEWSSSKHGFHAISTVLNNPHKKQAPPKAHSALPAVPPADLPRVKRKDFDTYLRGIAPEWERYERNQQLGKEGSASIDGSSSAFPPPTPIPETPFTPATPRTPRPPPGRTLPPLNSVPPIFFEAGFDLGQPRTFDLVTEQAENDRDPSADPSSLSYSLPLLEKLSHHADTIEQHLVREVSLRSTSFFAALSNLHELQTESEQCLDRISHLRGLLREVDEKGAKKGLQIVRKEQRLRNLGSVREGVKMLGGMVEMTGVAKSLVNAGQWGEALGVVEQLDSLWTRPAELEPMASNALASRSPKPSRHSSQNGRAISSPFPAIPESPTAPLPSRPTVPLSSLAAFSALPTHLQVLTMDISQSLAGELVRVLQHDLSERIAADMQSAQGQAALQTGLRESLRPLLQGLVRTKTVPSMLEPWRDAVMDQVRLVVKQHLPPAVDVDSADLTSTEALRNMAHTDFLALARTMYRSLLNCTEGLSMQNTVFAETLSSLLTPETDMNSASLFEELSDILASATELGNARAAKVVLARSEQHTGLDLPSFVAFFNESWNFVVKCEVVCRRMIVGLRGVIVSQAKAFLQAFHQARISQSAEFVHDEQWTPAEVLPAMQRLVDILVDSAVRDPQELTLSPDGTAPAVAAPPPSNGTNGTSSKQLRIEDRTFFAVSATLQVLTLLVDYLKVIVNLSMLTTDTMSRVIEFLRAWNSRTCQVVLGAGAMRSAGLKNITARHLALASQSLSIMISLVPYVRETFRRHLNAREAVMLVEFDKLKRDFQEHQEEIHKKLIQIMGDRLTVHLRKLQEVDWRAARSKAGPSEYMETLVKETVTLHKILFRYLSPPVVEYVMSDVLADIYHRMGQEFSKITLPSPDAKDRLLGDARYCQEKLSSLKSIGVRSNVMLETIVADKPVAQTGVAQPLPPQPQLSPQLPPVAVAPTPAQRASPFSANQRIKGMLARATTKQVSTDGTAPRTDEKSPISTTPVEKVPLNLNEDGTHHAPSNGALPPITQPPTKPSSGFKQIEETTTLTQAHPPTSPPSPTEGAAPASASAPQSESPAPPSRLDSPLPPRPESPLPPTPTDGGEPQPSSTIPESGAVAANGS